MVERLFDRPPPEAGLWMQVWADSFLSALEQVPAIQEALSEAIEDANDAAALAIAAAISADEAAEAVTAEQALVQSYPTNFTAPLVSADDAGNVTIADHDRQYSDGTPPVPVDGDTIATTATTGEKVRIYYDDPDREGGTVSYLYTIDPADPPVQGNGRHSVGAAVIPAAGSQAGEPLQPPGYVNIS